TAMETLKVLATQPGDHFQLFARLDSLGDHAEIETRGERDDRPHDFGGLAPGQDVAYEAVVDLQPSERQAAQVAEARVPGPEVIDGDAHAAVAQASQDAHRVLGFLHDHRLGEFELEVTRIEAACGQR